MPKKGEKVVSEEQLEKLALARQKALEVRRANKEIKDKEKELVRLEKENKKKDLDESITVARKKTVRDLGGNEVPVENTQSQKQRDHEQSYEENLELDVKPKSKPRASKKKVKYVYESESSSEEEVVIVRKKKGGNKKQTQESNEVLDNEKSNTEVSQPSNAKPQMTPQEIQRQQYLQRVSQMPQYRTNLFGDHY
jgi:hypothetical protein